MSLLSKSAILCANDLQTEDAEVPEWGGALRLRRGQLSPLLLPQLRRIHRDVEQGHAVGECVVKNRFDDVGRVVGQLHHAASPESGAQFGIHKKTGARCG